MSTYFDEAEEYREIRGFHYGKEYSLQEAAHKLGFRGERRELFYKVLIEHGILLHDHSPTYLAFISDYLTYGEEQIIVVTYPGSIMLGDLLESVM